MSVLVSIKDSIRGNSHRVVSKGAPEVLCKYFKEIPEGYKESYLKYVRDGARVLALAYKQVGSMSHAEAHAYTREEAESNLIFCGFIVAECPMKPDTRDLIVELK